MASIRSTNTVSVLFFFQIFASEILQFVRGDDETVECVFGRDDNDEYEYLNKVRWEGFVFCATQMNKSISFSEAVLGLPAFSTWW